MRNRHPDFQRGGKKTGCDKLRGHVYYLKNVDKYKNNVSCWRERNRDKHRAINMRYITCKRNACPKWLTESHHAQINQLYGEALRRELVDGKKRHVDHIWPINHEITRACGLHVPWNLQIISASANITKRNKAPKV